MSQLNSKRISKTTNDTFPVIDTIKLVDAISLQLNLSGSNAIDYKFTNSGTTGRLTKENPQFQAANSDSINDVIQFTFYGASSVEAIWSKGNSAGAGSATAANQVIIIDYLNGTNPSVLSGNIENGSLVEYLIDNSTDVCLSCTLLFEGDSGELDGVVVQNGFIATYTGTLRNQIGAIPFKVPTAPNVYGNQRVLVAYTKL